MPELPAYMLKGDRQVDPEFTSDEDLYRRVPPEYWDDESVELDAIKFPDMSVTRQKYGPPESARWESREIYLDWGVFGFRVADIPADVPFQGTFVYRMQVMHVPIRPNYPHCEVRVFETKWDEPDSERRIVDSMMPGIDPRAKQEWRDLLRRKCRIVLRPKMCSEPEVLVRYAMTMS